MKSHSVKVTAKKAPAGKHKARHIELRKADNGGYISRTSFEQPKSKSLMGNDYVEDKETVHPDLAHFQAHAADAFGEEAPAKGEPMVEDKDKDGE